MKRLGTYLTLSSTGMWVIPKLLTRFGKMLGRVHSNVFNVGNISVRDIKNFCEDMGLRESQYMVNPGHVSRWPLPVFVLSEKDLSRVADLEKDAGFAKVLITGALKTLKVASTITFNFRLAYIVRTLEKWVKETYK